MSAEASDLAQQIFERVFRPEAELPPWADIIPRLHLLLPIPAMIFFLVIGDSAFLAGGTDIHYLEKKLSL